MAKKDPKVVALLQLGEELNPTVHAAWQCPPGQEFFAPHASVTGTEDAGCLMFIHRDLVSVVMGCEPEAVSRMPWGRLHHTLHRIEHPVLAAMEEAHEANPEANHGQWLRSATENLQLKLRGLPRTAIFYCPVHDANGDPAVFEIGGLDVEVLVIAPAYIGDPVVQDGGEYDSPLSAVPSHHLPEDVIDAVAAAAEADGRHLSELEKSAMRCDECWITPIGIDGTANKTPEGQSGRYVFSGPCREHAALQ